MEPNQMVHVRVDTKLKNEAAETLASIGLSMSDAVRVFLTRVVAERGMPFELKIPNAASQAAIAEAREIAAKHQARFGNSAALIESLEKNGNI